MPRYVSPGSLAEHIGTRTCPHVVDVRREGDFLSAETRIPASRWRDHMETAEWAAEVADRRPVVVYCTHGHNVSEIAAAGLAAQGLDVSILEGGIEAIVIAADPKTLGQIRQHCHKELESRIVGDLAKDLTNSPMPEIERILAAA